MVDGDPKAEWFCEKCNAKEVSSSEEGEDGESTILAPSSKSRKVRYPTQPDNPESKPSDVAQSISDLKNFFIHKFDSLEESLKFNGKIMEDLTKEIKKVQEENKTLKKENTKLKEKQTEMEKDLHYIKTKLNQEEQRKLKNSMEISGIPPAPDHKQTILKIGALMKIPLQENDILNVRKTYIKTGGINSITVDFRNAITREKLLTQCKENIRKKEFLDTNKIGIPGEKKIVYLNEALTPETRYLFSQAKKLKQRNYKYVWMKDGVVYVRKSEVDRAIRIRFIEDVLKLEE
ncbi:unnamed protein product [Phaedon cochleariae]|uniref:FP protein C-terminal domain-containing protein n=1 Tax=Phaedon cochleariae TaxID=80249 RepID=A0A9P0DLB5_PHACE|nr:unnamed protein product [Phaedon cochleariae]